MNKLYVLVGIPAAGKSTWVENQDWTKDCAIVSTDHFVDAEALRVSKTYNEIFKEYMPTAVKLMAKQVIEARESGLDIVWDQTSTTVNSRKKKFNMLPDYYAIAVVFKTPPLMELEKRLKSRSGKLIPRHVVESMIENFEMPTEAEGFKEIWHAS